MKYQLHIAFHGGPLWPNSLYSIPIKGEPATPIVGFTPEELRQAAIDREVFQIGSCAVHTCRRG